MEKSQNLPSTFLVYTRMNKPIKTFQIPRIKGLPPQNKGTNQRRKWGCNSQMPSGAATVSLAVHILSIFVSCILNGFLSLIQSKLSTIEALLLEFVFSEGAVYSETASGPALYYFESHNPPKTGIVGKQY